jgi:hypothetical protein
MRKKLLLLSIISLTISNLLSAQTTDLTGLLQSMRGSNSWKYSPELSEEELYMYDRLLYMSKEDWELFRSDLVMMTNEYELFIPKTKGNLAILQKEKAGLKGPRNHLQMTVNVGLNRMHLIPHLILMTGQTVAVVVLV